MYRNERGKGRKGRDSNLSVIWDYECRMSYFMSGLQSAKIASDQNSLGVLLITITIRPSLRHSRHTFCWELIKAFRAIRWGQSCSAEQTAVSSQQGYERSSKQRICMLRWKWFPRISSSQGDVYHLWNQQFHKFSKHSNWSHSYFGSNIQWCRWK